MLTWAFGWRVLQSVACVLQFNFLLKNFEKTQHETWMQNTNTLNTLSASPSVDHHIFCMKSQSTAQLDSAHLWYQLLFYVLFSMAVLSLIADTSLCRSSWQLHTKLLWHLPCLINTGKRKTIKILSKQSFVCSFFFNKTKCRLSSLEASMEVLPKKCLVFSQAFDNLKANKIQGFLQDFLKLWGKASWETWHLKCEIMTT